MNKTTEIIHNYIHNFQWSENTKDLFISNINMAEIMNLQERLEHATTLNVEPNQASLVDSLNDITDSIADIFTRAALKSLKQKKQPFQKRNFDKPWFGLACKIARKKYHRALNIYTITKSYQAKCKLNHESKQYKQTMNKYIKMYKIDKTKKLRNMQTKNPKEYWKYLKSLKTKNYNSQPSLNEFYDYFKTINKTNEPQHEAFNINVENDENTLNRKITSDEISQSIKNLKNGKASGEDKIINEYIKSTKELFLPTYEKLFNSVFDSGFIPNSWLEGTIRPIYKNKGDPKLVQNYRPITILSCLGKLFTAILNKRLTLYLDNNETILENQAGFRKGYAATDHIFVLSSLIEILKGRKQKLFCAFIDFSQAFDSIWRVGLWRKLIFNSVDGKFFELLLTCMKVLSLVLKLMVRHRLFLPASVVFDRVRTFPLYYLPYI